MTAIENTAKTWTVGEVVTAADLNTELRDKMNDIKSRVADTGWKPITLTNTSVFEAYTTAAENAPVYRKVGNRVTLAGALQMKVPGAIDGISSQTWGQVPTDCAPPSGYGQKAVFLLQGSSENHWCLTVSSDGTLTASRYGPGASSDFTWLPFYVEYYTD